MSEEIINYQKDRQPSWWERKRKGLNNRVGRLKRHAGWWYHVRFRKPIQLDYSKLPKGCIPILINTFNRLSVLENSLEWMEKLEGEKAFIIVDNDSTYPPLLEYYKSLTGPNIQVVYLEFNSWKNGCAHIGEKLLNDYPYYIVTDPDLEPYPDMPADLLLHLRQLMEQFPSYNHIGCSLEINDLPDHYPLKKEVQDFESKYWPPQAKALANNTVFDSFIDSTFAMYRPNSNMPQYHNALRTNRPYRLKHLDWYQDPNHISDEFAYYLKRCKTFATWAAAAKQLDE